MVSTPSATKALRTAWEPEIFWAVAGATSCGAISVVFAIMNVFKMWVVVLWWIFFVIRYALRVTRYTFHVPRSKG